MPSAPKSRASLASAGVSALVRTPIFSHPVRPLHQFAEIATDFGGHGRKRTQHHLAGATVDGDRVPLFDLDLTDPHAAFFVVDLEGAATGDTTLAHAARDHGGVGGHSAAGGQDALGREHPADVFSRCLQPDQDHLFARLRAQFRSLAVENRHPGRAVVPHVSEDHRLDVDRRAPVVGDVVQTPIDFGPLVLPGAEHRADRTPQLLHRILGKRSAGLLLGNFEEVMHQTLEILGVEFGIEMDSLGVFHVVDPHLEPIPRNVQHHVAIHLNQAAITVVRKAFVRPGRKPEHRLAGQSEIQDAIHHARHRSPGPRSYRQQQWIFGVAEACTDRVLELGDGRNDRRLDPAWDDAALPIELSTDFGRDRESGGHRNPEQGHFRQVCPFATEHVAHLGAAVRLASAKGIHLAARPFGWGGSAPGALFRRRFLRTRSRNSRPGTGLACASFLSCTHLPRARRFRKKETSPSIGTRSCSIESRSRTVTWWSSSESKS